MDHNSPRAVAAGQCHSPDHKDPAEAVYSEGTPAGDLPDALSASIPETATLKPFSDGKGASSATLFRASWDEDHNNRRRLLPFGAALACPWHPGLLFQLGKLFDDLCRE